MRAFSIIGWSGSGKTLLITRLIEEFKARGKSVIAVKSTHAGYGLQPEGKDTARFLQAGARETYLLAGNELLRMTRIAAADDLLDDLQARLGPDDIVLLEGLTRPGIPLIEVEAAGGELAAKSRPGEPVARVSASADPGAHACFRPDDITAIRSFMEEYHER
ncbi:MAG: molybdopterin-guanine dinucleotide biosynthesis protein B [Acidobacteria bacterium]|jgi:molybdopterin-guanine dinucleotide biosynthesis protein B|nr:molybdopterin-guanine dinucleotide biosynthesis protein B [Acidobacteriota bacterium]